VILTATDIACDRGGRRVFENLGFTLIPGDYLELRGTNGAGKSSLLRLLAGFNEPAAGTLTMEPGNGRIADQANYVGHHDAIKPVLTVRENLTFWKAAFGTGNVDDALLSFGLVSLADDAARLLSQGQKRRLALSRLALISRPVWLLDEPTVGLDTSAVENLCIQIKKHVSNGGAAIVATHETSIITPTQTITLADRS
jgi:heme exporter protein A